MVLFHSHISISFLFLFHNTGVIGSLNRYMKVPVFAKDRADPTVANPPRFTFAGTSSHLTSHPTHLTSPHLTSHPTSPDANQISPHLTRR